MAKKEGKFGLTHIFATAAITLGTSMIIDPLFVYNWTHFSEGGQAIGQIGNALTSSFYDAASEIVVPILDPFRDALVVTTEIVTQTADGAKVIADTAETVSASAGVTAAAANPLLGQQSVPVMK